MKNLKIDNRTKLIGIRKDDEEVNYYIQTPTNEMIYALSRNLSLKEWDICKSGIRIEDLFVKRIRQEGVMNLVKHVKYIIPYLCQEYNLLSAQGNWYMEKNEKPLLQTLIRLRVWLTDSYYEYYWIYYIIYLSLIITKILFLNILIFIEFKYK